MINVDTGYVLESWLIYCVAVSSDEIRFTRDVVCDIDVPRQRYIPLPRYMGIYTTTNDYVIILYTAVDDYARKSMRTMRRDIPTLHTTMTTGTLILRQRPVTDSGSGGKRLNFHPPPTFLCIPNVPFDHYILL